MKIKIQVTYKHIAAGERFSPNCCPLGLALREQFPGQLITVGVTQFSIGENRFNLPGKVVRFIHDFDGQRTVHALSFEIYEPKVVDGLTNKL